MSDPFEFEPLAPNSANPETNINDNFELVKEKFDAIDSEPVGATYPAGGTDGQLLAKDGNTDPNAVKWTNPPTGGGSGGSGSYASDAFYVPPKMADFTRWTGGQGNPITLSDDSVVGLTFEAASATGDKLTAWFKDVPTTGDWSVEARLIPSIRNLSFAYFGLMLFGNLPSDPVQIFGHNFSSSGHNSHVLAFNGSGSGYVAEDITNINTFDYVFFRISYTASNNTVTWSRSGNGKQWHIVGTTTRFKPTKIGIGFNQSSSEVNKHFGVCNYWRQSWAPFTSSAEPNAIATFPDAPKDGKTYGRKDGNWTEGGGLPVGGSIGQLLTKKSGIDYDAEWGVAKTQLDIITASATWTKPLWAKKITIFVMAGGGGGGSGRTGAAGTARGGGGGGGAGAYNIETYLAAELAAQLSVIVGAGGNGGALVSAQDTNGNPGSSGGTTIVTDSNNVQYLVAIGGGGGVAGSAISVGGGAAGGGQTAIPVGSGGTGNPSVGGSGGSSQQGSSGGGGGGGLSAADATSSGGNGGFGYLIGSNLRRAPSTGGGGVGANGSVGANKLWARGGASGGAGGGSSSTTAGSNAGSGGVGGIPAAGGGGGGGALNTGQSGAGGNGGRGEVWILSEA